MTAKLTSARGLEELGIAPRATIYKMVEAGLLPSYRVGQKRRGLRFIVEEVLVALRQPGSQTKTI